MANWTQLGLDIDGEAASDNSGSSVSLSDDGTIMAIGAYGNDDGPGSNAGHVRVYEYSGGSWSQKGADIDGEAGDDYSGVSVSLSSDGSRVAIGAYLNDGTDSNAGHVRVYEWNGGTSAWDQKGADIDGEAGDDYSGVGVSLSSDGSILAIGAYLNDGGGMNAGHVRVYEYNSGTSSWDQKGDDIDGEAASDNSGYGVSLSDDGTIVAIGAVGNDDGPGYTAGHVRVYEWNGGTSAWDQKGADIDGEAIYDHSGYSVSLSSDGSRVAIGAYRNDGTDTDSGQVRVYEYSGSSWGQIGADIDGEAIYDYSGYSVSLSSDGSRVAIGSRENDGGGSNAGHVRVYEYKTITETEYNNGNTANTTGAVGVPVIIDGGVSWGASTKFWVQQGDDIDGEASDDASGRSVSLSSDGSIVAIGAYYNDGGGSNAGHVGVYSFSVLAVIQKIIADNDYVNGAAIVHVSRLPNVPKTRLSQTINDNTGIDNISEILSTRFDDTFYYTGDE